VLTLALPTRVFLCLPVTDMRRSFDGLAALVRKTLDQDPLSGDLFVFRNRRGDRLKLLWWDEDGLAIWYKRLEEGVFPFPAVVDDQVSLTIRATDLALILDGVDLKTVRRGKRYGRSAVRAVG
jgi:transposase